MKPAGIRQSRGWVTLLFVLIGGAVGWWLDSRYSRAFETGILIGLILGYIVERARRTEKLLNNAGDVYCKLTQRLGSSRSKRSETGKSDPGRIAREGSWTRRLRHERRVSASPTH